jgi:hypothetical protein
VGHIRCTADILKPGGDVVEHLPGGILAERLPDSKTDFRAQRRPMTATATAPRGMTESTAMVNGSTGVIQLKSECLRVSMSN